MVGNNITHQRLVMDLIEETGAGVFFINYTLCPEVVYPVPIEQSYAAIQWLHANGKTHGLDTEKIALAGDSAGGKNPQHIAKILEIKLKIWIYKQVQLQSLSPFSLSNARPRSRNTWSSLSQ